MKPLGVIFLLFGMIALIPFKADYLQMWDIPLFTLAVLEHYYYYEQVNVLVGD